MNGIINIYKEAGYTSHDVVAVVKKMLNCSKVGHTGTLDPEAEGVLPICIGKATKISDYIMSDIKRYTAELTLGISTTTQDNTGEIIQRCDVNFDKDVISKLVSSFKGKYLQIPPMYSAIKINGQRLYKLAREGKTVERKPREIDIYSIDILKFMPPDKVSINVVCSKGTYIRTLCADIGQKLGCGAHMSSLLRTQTGQFFIQNSIKLSQLLELKDSNRLENVIVKIDEALGYMPKVYTKQNVYKLLCNGSKIYSYGIYFISESLKSEQQVLVYDFKKNFVGIYTTIYDENNLCIKPVKILI